MERLGGTNFWLEGAGLARGFRGFLPRLLHGRGRLGTLRTLVQFEDAAVGDLPAEGLDLALLLVTLFEEDRLPGIGGQIAGRGQYNVPGAVRHDDPMA